LCHPRVTSAWVHLIFQGCDPLSRQSIQFLKKSLRPLRQKIRRFNGVLLFRFLKVCCILLKPKIALTYLNTIKADGVGAQIQRILAIRSLSNSLNLGYLHTEIKSLAIHPLDSYQNNDEMEVFLLKLNHEFWMQDTEESFVKNLRELQTNTLTFSFMFSCILQGFFSKKQTLVKIVEPYPISEYDPHLYQGIRQFLPHFVLPPKTGVVVAVHYRRGVGGFAVQRGERISREIAGNYFAALAKKIIDDGQISDLKLLVYTDSPTEDVVFTPPNNQSHLWTNSERFSEGRMHVLGLDVEEVFKKISVGVKVVYGGDPLDVIKSLASADHLILSRSSFGYVAAILNTKGQVYFPSQFWHVPMKGWQIIRESTYD
jgi:hypothetical protein